MGNKIIKKINLVLLGLVILSAVFAFYPEKLLQYATSVKPDFSSESNQFLDDTKGIEIPSEGNIINSVGTVNYFKENFNSYSQNSKIIEEFDDMENLELRGLFTDEKLSSDSYSGTSSLSLTVLPSSVAKSSLIVKKQLKNPLDLTRWADSGILSMWIKIENRKSFAGVNLKIGDINGNFREFKEIKNLQVNIPNNYDSDDVYPDVEMSKDPTVSSIWTDYWLNKGWNYLFWKNENGSYLDTGKLDLKNISWLEIDLNEEGAIQKQILTLDDLRIQDGLLKNANVLGDTWYPPDNKAQNGIYDLNNPFQDRSFVKLFNVRQSQYPTNGDHGRMVLRHGTPLNFAMRTKFMLTNFPKNNSERVNTRFRVAYDFDSSYDPGHDWFGAFISFEWNKFGLTTVIPIEKDSIQEWEPKKENIAGSSVDFIPQENTLYEIHLTARGQKATTSIYEVSGNNLIPKGTTSYEFQRPRHDNSKRYPFCLEITGNIKAQIYEVEIKEL